MGRGVACRVRHASNGGGARAMRGTVCRSMASEPGGESGVGACSGIGSHGEGSECREMGKCREFHVERRAGRLGIRVRLGCVV